MVEQPVGVVQLELDQPLGTWLILLFSKCLASAEAAGFVPRDGEPEPGLERGVLVGDVVTPVAVARFEAHRVHRVVAGVGEAVGAPGLDEGVVEGDGVVACDVDLPPEFADVGEANREHVDAGDPESWAKV